MEIRNIGSFTALYFETTTSLAEINEFVRVVASRLYKSAVENDLEIAGPVQWVYIGADGNPQTKFLLTILIPVITEKKTIESKEFRLKTTDFFKCIGKRHDGDWALLGNTYLELFSSLQAENLLPSGENREYYIHMDFEHPEHNITEVLIGIQ